MKKKIALLIVVSMLFGGIVSAAGLYGTFEGYQIVRVQSNGQTLVTDDVPAVNLNGRTMVPIYMLRDLGADVSWDGSTETVDVNLPEKVVNVPAQQFNQVRDLSDFIKSAKDSMKNYGIVPENYEVIIDDLGMYVSVVYNVDGLSENSFYTNVSIMGSLPSVLKYNELGGTIIETRLNGVKTSSIVININDADKYMNQQITFNQFVSTWSVTSTSNITFQSETTQTPNYCQSIITLYDESYAKQKAESNKYFSMSSEDYDKRYLAAHEENKNIALMANGCTDGITAEQGQSIAACKNINDKYDDSIRQTQEEYGARGLGSSSMLTDAINKIEQNRTNELIQNNCI